MTTTWPGTQSSTQMTVNSTGPWNTSTNVRPCVWLPPGASPHGAVQQQFVDLRGITPTYSSRPGAPSLEFRGYAPQQHSNLPLQPSFSPAVAPLAFSPGGASAQLSACAASPFYAAGFAEFAVAAGAAAAPASTPSVIVFLDVDGVLHPEMGKIIFTETCCRRLARIIHCTGASVVLSSTWRKYEDKFEKLSKVFGCLQLPPIFDRTPDFGGVFRRDAEICDWLDRHPGVVRWIAIDDIPLDSFDSPHAKRLVGHFVNTRSEAGLSEQDADKAIALLTSGGFMSPRKVA